MQSPSVLVIAVLDLAPEGENSLRVNPHYPLVKPLPIFLFIFFDEVFSLVPLRKSVNDPILPDL